MTILIEKIRDLSLDCLTDMIAESTSNGFNAIQRFADEWASGVNRFERNGEALFVAQQDSRIVGICGLNIDPYATSSTAGRVRRLYVMSEYRRRGIGRALVERIIYEASPTFKRLYLRTHSEEADAFYRAVGFVPHFGNEYFTHILNFL